MSQSIFGLSLGLNGLFISLFGFKAAYNYYITRVAQKQLRLVVNRIMDRYYDCSLEDSPEFSRTVDQFNRILRQIIPELNLPDDLTTEQTKVVIEKVLKYIFQLIRLDLVYLRYKFIPRPVEIEVLLRQLYTKLEDLDLNHLVSTISKIIEHPEPVSSYLIKCQYGDLFNISQQLEEMSSLPSVPTTTLTPITLTPTSTPTTSTSTSTSTMQTLLPFYALCCGQLYENVDYCAICNKTKLKHIKPELLINICEKLATNDDQVCSITLQPFEDTTPIGILTCGHLGEYSALNKWIELRYQCYNRCQIEPWTLNVNQVISDSTSTFPSELESESP